MADHAYWVSGLKLRDGAGPGPDRRGLARLRRGRSRAAATPSAGTGTLEGGNLGTLIYTMPEADVGRRRRERRSRTASTSRPPASSRRSSTSTRAHVGCDADVDIASDGPLAITLAGCNRTVTRVACRAMSANGGGNRTFVIGVGMTKFEKPGTKEGDYPDWAKEAGEKALADAGDPVRRGRAGLRGLLLRRLDLRPARGLRARPHRHPGLQRQQQLLDRLDGALPGAPGGEGRPRRLRARARLREDGEGLARREVHRPHEPDGQAREGDGRGARPGAGAARAADVRQRRPRAHGEVRHSPSTSRRSAGRTTSTR